MSSLDLLLDEIYSRGWTLYSLRDCADHRADRWEATIRYPADDPLVAYGQGPSAHLAISAAIDGIDRAESYLPPVVTIHTGEVPAGKSNGQSIVSDALRRLLNRPAIERRI